MYDDSVINTRVLCDVTAHLGIPFDTCDADTVRVGMVHHDDATYTVIVSDDLNTDGTHEDTLIVVRSIIDGVDTTHTTIPNQVTTR